MKRNPKQDGTNIFNCIPQSGKCLIGCNQCFFNRENAFYTETPAFPTLEEVGNGIVKINDGNDSNLDREYVIQSTEKYAKRFFNTSIPNFDFPAPVVFTANRREELWATSPPFPVPPNLMFVRLRVSSTNLNRIDRAVKEWTGANVPVVLTFMAYYDNPPANVELYEWKIRHVNEYWCPKPSFIQSVRNHYINNRLVSICESYCKTCLNCETYYIQTAKRMKELSF